MENPIEEFAGEWKRMREALATPPQYWTGDGWQSLDEGTTRFDSEAEDSQLNFFCIQSGDYDVSLEELLPTQGGIWRRVDYPDSENAKPTIYQIRCPAAGVSISFVRILRTYRCTDHSKNVIIPLDDIGEGNMLATVGNKKVEIVEAATLRTGIRFPGQRLFLCSEVYVCPVKGYVKGAQTSLIV